MRDEHVRPPPHFFSQWHLIPPMAVYRMCGRRFDKKLQKRQFISLAGGSGVLGENLKGSESMKRASVWRKHRRTFQNVIKRG